MLKDDTEKCTSQIRLVKRDLCSASPKIYLIYFSAYLVPVFLLRVALSLVSDVVVTRDVITVQVHI